MCSPDVSLIRVVWPLAISILIYPVEFLDAKSLIENCSSRLGLLCLRQVCAGQRLYLSVIYKTHPLSYPLYRDSGLCDCTFFNALPRPTTKPLCPCQIPLSITCKSASSSHRRMFPFQNPPPLIFPHILATGPALHSFHYPLVANLAV